MNCCLLRQTFVILQKDSGNQNISVNHREIQEFKGKRKKRHLLKRAISVYGVDQFSTRPRLPLVFALHFSSVLNWDFYVKPITNGEGNLCQTLSVKAFSCDN